MPPYCYDIPALHCTRQCTALLLKQQFWAAPGSGDGALQHKLLLSSVVFTTYVLHYIQQMWYGQLVLMPYLLTPEWPLLVASQKAAALLVRRPLYVGSCSCMSARNLCCFSRAFLHQIGALSVTTVRLRAIQRYAGVRLAAFGSQVLLLVADTREQPYTSYILYYGQACPQNTSRAAGLGQSQSQHLLK